MASGPPSISPMGYAPNDPRRGNALYGRHEEAFARQQQRFAQPNDRSDLWSSTRPSPAVSYPPGLMAAEQRSYQNNQSQRWGTDPDWSNRRNVTYPESSPWPASPGLSQFPQSNNQSPANSQSYSPWESNYPQQGLQRSPPESTRMNNNLPNNNNNHNQNHNSYYGEAASSTTSIHSSGKTYPQRRPSNRDEFDGPSQLLDKPADGDYEPKEEDLPQLPITLYAQEQDEILTKVNDRLSQCGYDFVARYQFPVPIEPDKRAVRSAADREWSEWVYLLKRLATKRRIPARVLYNGQIKQLITILENSLEMRHAAKHQSRPLKDDRNILQLISSGLQVAKILKDPRAMQYLDSLYVQTERLIQGRRATIQPASFGGI